MVDSGVPRNSRQCDARRSPDLSRSLGLDQIGCLSFFTSLSLASPVGPTVASAAQLPSPAAFFGDFQHPGTCCGSPNANGMTLQATDAARAAVVVRLGRLSWPSSSLERVR
ncbi:hypothetical protein TgHK011_008264 [Trichoderma gracile]|nr:hypothetical protein TgHK011_008264 [Trichoderma gracile]